MKKIQLLSLNLLFISITVIGQIPSDSEFLIYAQNSYNQLQELLLIPNDAHFPKDIEKNVQWCEKEFSNRGFQTTRLNTETVPLLLAERKTNSPNAKNSTDLFAGRWTTRRPTVLVSRQSIPSYFKATGSGRRLGDNPLG